MRVRPPSLAAITVTSQAEAAVCKLKTPSSPNQIKNLRKNLASLEKRALKRKIGEKKRLSYLFLFF